MATVVVFEKYRAQKKKLWLESHHQRFQSFIRDFLKQALDHSLGQVLKNFQQLEKNQQNMSWDYLELRDYLEEVMDELVRVELYEELKTQWWFAKKIISPADVAEQCLSLYLLDLIDLEMAAAMSSHSRIAPLLSPA